jgi:SAM-dependent methyltransferase
VIDHLPRIIEEAPGRPTRGDEDHPMRKVTRQVAFDPDGWTPERAGKVASLFDSLASEWHTREHPLRLVPVADAFERGGPLGYGTGLEIGSGTGLGTAWLSARFELLVAVELSAEMLRLAPADAAPRVQADAAALPVPDNSVDAVVLINMLLFPDEVARVLKPDGALVWVNTSGDRTPIHLTADEVDAAMPGEWSGVASEAAWGTWAVLRRP